MNAFSNQKGMLKNNISTRGNQSVANSRMQVVSHENIHSTFTIDWRYITINVFCVFLGCPLLDDLPLNEKELNT